MPENKNSSIEPTLEGTKQPSARAQTAHQTLSDYIKETPGLELQRYKEVLGAHVESWRNIALEWHSNNMGHVDKLEKLGELDIDAHETMVSDVNTIKELAEKIPEGNSTKVAGLDIQRLDRQEVGQLYDLMKQLPEADQVAALQLTKDLSAPLAKAVDHTVAVEKDIKIYADGVEPSRLADADMSPTDLKMMQRKLNGNVDYHASVGRDWETLGKASDSQLTKINVTPDHMTAGIEKVANFNSQAKPQANINPNEVTTEIRRVLEDVPARREAFPTKEVLELKTPPIEKMGAQHVEKIIGNVELQQQKSIDQNAEVFAAGKTAEETAKNFVDANINQDVRASLPGSTIHNARQLDLDPNGPGYKASITIATMAENTVGQGLLPAYHNQQHFKEVGEITTVLIQKNDEMFKSGVAGAVDLSEMDKGLLAAIAPGHDLAHAGNSNPEGDHYFNEKKSFELMKPVLEDAGFSKADIARAEIIIKTTSPNGAHAVLKGVAKAHEQGVAVDWDKLDPDNKFLDLRVLDGPDGHKLTQMAAMLSDADLYASSGAGMEANIAKSLVLSQEMGMDLTTDGARKFFLDNIVGGQYASAAGREMADKTLTKLLNKTNDNLEATKKAAAEVEAQKNEGAKPTEAETQKNAVPDTPKVGFNKAALGASGAGLVMGAQGLNEAIKTGDKTGMAISGTDVAVSAADLAVDTAATLGKAVSPLLQASLRNLNIGVLIAETGYQVYKEEDGSKLARAGAGGATVTTAMGVGALATTIAAGGAATTVAVIAAPIATAVAVGYGANKVVETQKAYRHLDENNAERAKGVSITEGGKIGPSGAPSIQNHVNLTGFALAEAGSKDNNPDIKKAAFNHVRSTDYSDPDVLKELEENLTEKIEAQEKIIENNDSVFPNWARGDSDSLGKQLNAEGKLSFLNGAKAELEAYKNEIEAHQNTIQTGLTKGAVDQNTSLGTETKNESSSPSSNGTEVGSHNSYMGEEAVNADNCLSSSFKDACHNTGAPKDLAATPTDLKVNVQPVTPGA